MRLLLKGLKSRLRVAVSSSLLEALREEAGTAEIDGKLLLSSVEPWQCTKSEGGEWDVGVEKQLGDLVV